MSIRGIIAALGGVFLFVLAPSISGQSELSSGSFADLTVVEAAEAIRAGDITSEELALELIERIDRYDYLNAFILFDADDVLAQARSADAEVSAGGALGALHGVPLIIKDNIDIAGLPTTAATPALVENIPAKNAPIVDALIEAGAIILGKANMHELALGSTGVGSAFGPALNPYNPLLFPGGSSSGTAAAVSARLAPAGLGSDTAGSIRMPSSMTGIYGFRPTVGRYSQDGIFPLSHSRDTAGPMARSMADVILLDSVITGESEAIVPVELSSLRLGVPRAHFYENLNAETARQIEEALSRLEAAGVTLVEADIPDVGALSESIFFPMALYELPRDMSAYLANTDVSLETVFGSIASPDVQGLLTLGPPEGIPEEAYQAAIDQQVVLQGVLAAYFEENDIDAIIFPTIPLPARPVADITGAADPMQPLIDLDGTPVTTLAYSQNVNIASSANLPGLSLPVGLTSDGLPVGIEIDGLTGDDRTILAIGLALEEALGEIPAPVLP
jgi:indoleacetamide hydrolase